MSEDIQTPEENLEEVEQGTEVEETTENPTEPEVDYKKKFSESSKEAQRLLDEKKAAEEELERLRAQYESNESGASYGNEPEEELYPGFDMLSEEEKQNLKNYTDNVTKSALDKVYKDPAIVEAKRIGNENMWDRAFESVADEFPEIRESKEDFKSKYFKADNVPDNIGDILKDLSKVYLFDKAKDLGAAEAIEKSERIEIERSNGGDKTPPVGRSMEDWARLAQENPAQFAKESKKYNEDLASGKL